MNYLFESLQATGRLEGPFQVLFDRFWTRYLQRSGDTQLLQVAAPFIAFRGLVMASPLWYPHIQEQTRRSLFQLIEAVLLADEFEPDRINEYLAVN